MENVHSILFIVFVLVLFSFRVHLSPIENIIYSNAAHNRMAHIFVKNTSSLNAVGDFSYLLLSDSPVHMWPFVYLTIKKIGDVTDSAHIFDFNVYKFS